MCWKEIVQNPTITCKELAARLNLSEVGVRYNTDKLQTKSILKRVGGKKAGRWEVVEGRLDASGGSGVGGGDERVAKDDN
jgi:predicted HTH transcriptional regulator